MSSTWIASTCNFVFFYGWNFTWLVEYALVTIEYSQHGSNFQNFSTSITSEYILNSIHIRASELVWLSRKLTLISHLKWSFSTTKLERERETRSKSSFGWLQRLSYIYDYGSPYILLETHKPEQAKRKKITSHMRSDSRFVYYLYEPLAFANESDSNSFLYSLPHFYVFISFTKNNIIIMMVFDVRGVVASSGSR